MATKSNNTVVYKHTSNTSVVLSDVTVKCQLSFPDDEASQSDLKDYANTFAEGIEEYLENNHDGVIASDIVVTIVKKG